jgi:hypothetical protein
MVVSEKHVPSNEDRGVSNRAESYFRAFAISQTETAKTVEQEAYVREFAQSDLYTKTNKLHH